MTGSQQRRTSNAYFVNFRTTADRSSDARWTSRTHTDLRRPCHWHLLTCGNEKGKEVHINKTGTFGVAGTASWWSRVATAAVRGAHHLLGHELALWLLLVADDLSMIVSHSRNRESVLLVKVFLRVMDFPLSWKKLAGGEILQKRRLRAGLS